MIFFAAETRSFVYLHKSFPRTIFTKETYNDMLMVDTLMGEMAQWDWGKGTYWNGIVEMENGKWKMENRVGIDTESEYFINHSKRRKW